MNPDGAAAVTKNQKNTPRKWTNHGLTRSVNRIVMMLGIVFMAFETKKVCDDKTTKLVKSLTTKSDTKGSIKMSKSVGSPQNMKPHGSGCRAN